MLMPKTNSASGLKMDRWSDDVINEAILYGGTGTHNRHVGLTARCTVFSHTFQGEDHFDYSFVFNGRLALYGAVQKALSPDHANLKAACGVAVVEDLRIGMERHLRLRASDGSDNKNRAAS